jgi:hypothetical protein
MTVISKLFVAAFKAKQKHTELNTSLVHVPISKISQRYIIVINAKKR